MTRYATRSTTRKTTLRSGGKPARGVTKRPRTVGKYIPGKFIEQPDEEKDASREKTIRGITLSVANARRAGPRGRGLKMVVLDSASLPLTTALKQVYPEASITVVEFELEVHRKQVTHYRKHLRPGSGPAPHFIFGNLLDYPLDGVNVLVADLIGTLTTPAMLEYAEKRLGPWMCAPEATFASVTRTTRGKCREGLFKRGSCGVNAAQQDNAFCCAMSPDVYNFATGQFSLGNMHLAHVQGWKRTKCGNTMNALEFYWRRTPTLPVYERYAGSDKFIGY